MGSAGMAPAARPSWPASLSPMYPSSTPGFGAGAISELSPQALSFLPSAILPAVENGAETSISFAASPSAATGAGALVGCGAPAGPDVGGTIAKSYAEAVPSVSNMRLLLTAATSLRPRAGLPVAGRASFSLEISDLKSESLSTAASLFKASPDDRASPAASGSGLVDASPSLPRGGWTFDSSATASMVLPTPP